MAELFPFRGYRYDPQKVGNVEHVVSQPYDKITEQMWIDYLKRHACNIVRIIKNRNYEEAGRYLREWIEAGILRQDPAPSFYPYEQSFEFEGQRLSRKGFIGLVPLQDAALKVRGHEKILNEPLQDRLNLIRATQANEGLIFMLYSDPSMNVENLLAEFTGASQPIAEVAEGHHISHRLWQMSEQQRQQQIQAALREAVLYIADGHHRFQTSLLFYDECREKGWKPAAVESFDKRMIALFNMHNPGLKILPTHRGVRNLNEFRVEELLANLKRYFVVESLVGLPELDLAMKDSGIRIGMATSENRFYVLHLGKDADRNPDFMSGLSGPARKLDVNVLHEGILHPFLGIGPEELASQRFVDYLRSREELIRSVREGQHQVGFILNPTTVEQVRQISERGEQMPQKSTDFYPKLLTGLVLMKMEIDKSESRRTHQLQPETSQPQTTEP